MSEHDKFCEYHGETMYDTRPCTCAFIARIRADQDLISRVDEREHWMREMEKHRDACDFGEEEDGECLGYDDCDHYLPLIYYRMQAAARGEELK